MKKQELNRDIKRLGKRFMNRNIGDTSGWSHKDWEDLAADDVEIKNEWKRLYNADYSLGHMNLSSIKIMLRINLAVRVIPLHIFGINIEIEKI